MRARARQKSGPGLWPTGAVEKKEVKKEVKPKPKK